jgi:hypothetical protein
MLSVDVVDIASLSPMHWLMLRRVLFTERPLVTMDSVDVIVGT